MSDLPRVHTGEPLVTIGDDDIAYRTRMPHWTMTEALFYLSGHKSPGYESTRHMQDHFWNTYAQAVRAIEMGEICRKIERAGNRVFIDSPANWFAWANGLGPEFIEIDARVRRALQSGDTDKTDSAATIRDETSCQKWLEGLMANKSSSDRPKRDYQSDAKQKFNVGPKPFNRAWANALVKTGNTNWSRPGPKPRS